METTTNNEQIARNVAEKVKDFGDLGATLETFHELLDELDVPHETDLSVLCEDASVVGLIDSSRSAEGVVAVIHESFADDVPWGFVPASFF